MGVVLAPAATPPDESVGATAADPTLQVFRSLQVAGQAAQDGLGLSLLPCTLRERRCSSSSTRSLAAGAEMPATPRPQRRRSLSVCWGGSYPLRTLCTTQLPGSTT